MSYDLQDPWDIERLKADFESITKEEMAILLMILSIWGTTGNVSVEMRLIRGFTILETVTASAQKK